ncbi:hypothetical protein KI387_036057, partial [Taxus chinensis]
MVAMKLEPKSRDSDENCTLVDCMRKLSRKKSMSSQEKRNLCTGATASLIDMKGESSKGKERVEMGWNLDFHKISLRVSMVERDIEALGEVGIDMGNNVMHYINVCKKNSFTQKSIRADMVEIKGLVLEFQGHVVKLEQGHSSQ